MEGEKSNVVIPAKITGQHGGLLVGEGHVKPNILGWRDERLHCNLPSMERDLGSLGH